MARRPPSAAQIRSQMRAAERKAMSQIKREIRKAERELTSEMRRSQQRMNRELDKEARRAERNLQRAVNSSTSHGKAKLPQGKTKTTVTYTPSERTYLSTIRESVETDPSSDQREHDAFLCHAWADRQEAAAELHGALESENLDVWFSEAHLVLGKNLPRELDRGMSQSKVGLVLVTPALLATLKAGGFAEQELGALLATGRVIPVCHKVSYDELQRESPLLASRAGLSTDESGFADVAAKIAETLLPKKRSK